MLSAQLVCRRIWASLVLVGLKGQISSSVYSIAECAHHIKLTHFVIACFRLWWLLDKDEMASRSKLSGIQRQVLALYRGFLRTARLKSPEERHRIESVVSAEFRENARNIDRKNFVYIEYLLRRGKKQLEQLKDPDITGLSTLEINKVYEPLNLK